MGLPVQISPGSGDGSKPAEKSVQGAQDMKKTVRIQESKNVKATDATLKNLTTNEEGEGDVETKKDLGNRNLMINIKPMEARVIANEVLEHLDDTFVKALLDRTGIVFEDWLSHCPDDMVTRL